MTTKQLLQKFDYEQSSCTKIEVCDTNTGEIDELDTKKAIAKYGEWFVVSFMYSRAIFIEVVETNEEISNWTNGL